MVQTSPIPKTDFSTKGNSQAYVSGDDVKVRLNEARSLRHLTAGGLQGIISVISLKEPKLQPVCTQIKICTQLHIKQNRSVEKERLGSPAVSCAHSCKSPKAKTDTGEKQEASEGVVSPM